MPYTSRGVKIVPHRPRAQEDLVREAQRIVAKPSVPIALTRFQSRYPDFLILNGDSRADVKAKKTDQRGATV